MKVKKLRFLSILVAVFLFLFMGVAAADYPTKPIKMIINFAPGGTSDFQARTIAQKAEKVLGQPIVATNKTGAGGTIGVSDVARAKPDGYTIGTCNMPALCIIPQMRKLPYDPFTSFTHVCQALPYEYAIMVKSDAPWKTWDELVKHIKKNPGTVTYGSVGTGTTNHLTMVRIEKAIGLDWIHVPFKGGTRETAALLGGNVATINNTNVSVVSPVRAGQIRLLMITSKNRWDFAPDVPTMSEKGFDFYQESYMSIIAPAGVPEEVRAKLENAFKVAIEDPEVKKASAKMYLSPEFKSGKEYAEVVKRLHREWGAVLKDLDLLMK
jgi:tripartite-type tricarboxylate transporter receptor subunit TctC